MTYSKLIGEINAWVLDDLDQKTSDAFEVCHYRDVVRYIGALAEHRGLDMETALAIGMLHDIGRIKLGKSGRAHAISGEMLASYYLGNKALDHQWIANVSQAVLYHRHKKAFHNPYCELIKDADSLAHFLYFGGHDVTWYEQARCQMAFVDRPLFQEKNYHKLGKKLDKGLESLVELLASKDLRKGASHMILALEDQVHKLLAILWVVKIMDKMAYEPLRGLEVCLKDVLRVFAHIQAYPHYIEWTQEASYTHELLINAYALEVGLLNKQIRYYIGSMNLSETIGTYKSLETRPMNCDKLYGKYRRLFDQQTLYDEKASKKILRFSRYLCALHEMKLVTMQKPMYETMKGLVAAINMRHTYRACKAMLLDSEHFKDLVPRDEQKCILRDLVHGMDQAHKEVKKYLFKMCLLTRDTHL